jgi:hypothetical protein
MTNKKVNEFYNQLNSNAVLDIPFFRVNYGLSKNRKALKSIIDSVIQRVNKVEGFNEYCVKINELIDDIKKNEDNFRLKEEAIQKSKDFQTSNQDLIDAVDEIWNEESTYEPYLIDISYFGEKISGIAEEIIFPLIKE